MIITCRVLSRHVVSIVRCFLLIFDWPCAWAEKLDFVLDKEWGRLVWLPALLRAWFIARVLTAPCPYKLETSSSVFQSHRICPKTFGPITTPHLVAHPLLHSRDNSISPIPFFSDTTTDESNNEILPSSNGTRPVTRRKSDCKLNPVFCPHISSWYVLTQLRISDGV